MSWIEHAGSWLLDDANLLASAALLVALLVIASIAGYRVGMRRRTLPGHDDLQNYVSTAQGIVFGLLSLLLAFTLSTGLSRSDARRTQLLNDTNTISTVYLRSQALPEPYASEARAELRGYINLRIYLYDAGRRGEVLDDVALQTANSQYRLWQQVQRMAHEHQELPLVTDYMSALTDMFSAHSSRVASLRNSIPWVVLALLVAIAVLAMFLMNVNRGMLGERRTGTQVLLASSIAAVIMVIIDLDGPRRGLIYVPDTAMVELREFVRGMPESTVQWVPQSEAELEAAEAPEALDAPEKSTDEAPSEPSGEGQLEQFDPVAPDDAVDEAPQAKVEATPSTSR